MVRNQCKAVFAGRVGVEEEAVHMFLSLSFLWTVNARVALSLSFFLLVADQHAAILIYLQYFTYKVSFLFLFKPTNIYTLQHVPTMLTFPIYGNLGSHHYESVFFTGMTRLEFWTSSGYLRAIRPTC